VAKQIWMEKENRRGLLISSSGNISPVLAVGWLSCVCRVMGSDALPYINTLAFWIPNTTLSVEIPVDVDLPDPCGVADYGGHGMGRGEEIR